MSRKRGPGIGGKEHETRRAPFNPSFGSAWLVLSAVLFAGCAQLPLEQREVLISAERLNEGLAKRVGLDKKLLDLSVKIERPTLTMDAPAQRLRVDFALSLSHPLSSRPVTGRAGISGALGYDASSLTVTFVDAKIESLHVDAVPPALRHVVGRLGSALGAELLPKYPLVTLREKDLIAYGREYRVSGFEILEHGVRVTLRARD